MLDDRKHLTAIDCSGAAEDNWRAAKQFSLCQHYWSRIDTQSRFRDSEPAAEGWTTRSQNALEWHSNNPWWETEETAER